MDRLPLDHAPDARAPDPLDDYVSAQALADYLGVSLPTLIRLHGLRSIRLGRFRVYRKSLVAAWLSRRELGD